MLLFGFFVLTLGCARAEIGGSSSALMNKLVKIKPVGSNLKKNFIPLTELPTPAMPTLTPPSYRRHLPDPDDCTPKNPKEVVYEGAKVAIFGDYYDDAIAKTVATIIFPDHIDHKHFEITTPPPYFTVGLIEAIGYHPSTPKNEHPPECEKIYQDHLADLYSDDATDYSDESLEVARMPLLPQKEAKEPEAKLAEIYSDLE